MSRVVFHLVYKPVAERWHLTNEGNETFSAYTKEEVLRHGQMMGRAHEAQGDKAQLVVHRADGSVETEYTYGDDPPVTIHVAR